MAYTSVNLDEGPMTLVVDIKGPSGNIRLIMHIYIYIDATLIWYFKSDNQKIFNFKVISEVHHNFLGWSLQFHAEQQSDLRGAATSH